MVNITPRTLYPTKNNPSGHKSWSQAFRREKKILAPARMRTDRPSRRVVTVLTELPYLIMVYSTAVFVNHMWVEAVVGKFRHRPSIHLDSPGHGGIHLDSPSHGGIHLDSPSHGWIHLDSPSHGGIHLDSPSHGGIHLDNPSHGGIHLDSPSHGSTAIATFITEARSRKIPHEEFNKSNLLRTLQW